MFGLSLCVHQVRLSDSGWLEQIVVEVVLVHDENNRSALLAVLHEIAHRASVWLVNLQGDGDTATSLLVHES